MEDRGGPIIEDLDILDDVADTLESVNTEPGILAEIEAFREQVGDRKDAVNDLETRLEGGQMSPSQALEELDRITNEARAPHRRAHRSDSRHRCLVAWTATLHAWKSAGIRLTAANAEYDAAYWSQDADTDIEYNPAATIRLTCKLRRR